MAQNLKFRIPTKNQYEEIIEHLFDFYFKDGTMSMALNLYDGVHKDPEIINDVILKTLEDNLSLVAIDGSSGKIVAVCANGIVAKPDKPLTKEHVMAQYKCPKLQTITEVIFNAHQKSVDLFDHFHTDNLFDISLLSVDRSHRGCGLALDLVKRSVQLAKCLGFKVAKAETTGIYSKKTFLKAGFEIMSECFYSDFISFKGEKPFLSVADEHKGLSLVTFKL